MPVSHHAHHVIIHRNSKILKLLSKLFSIIHKICSFHKCLFVCPSVHQQNPSYSQKSIIPPQHHPDNNAHHYPSHHDLHPHHHHHHPSTILQPSFNHPSTTYNHQHLCPIFNPINMSTIISLHHTILHQSLNQPLTLSMTPM